MLRTPRDEALRLAQSIIDLKEKVSFCRHCYTFAEGELCRFCSDGRRDPTTICAVEAPQDIVAIERTGEYRGRYHVLGGAISPLQGIGPDELRIKELIARLQPEGVKEVIVATNPTVEGEVTASYLAQALRPHGVVVTRPASGLPVGGDLEYADEVTLGRALEGRRELAT
jgi:recombination protein RecR